MHLGAGGSHGQEDPGEETLPQHLPSCQRQTTLQQLQQGATSARSRPHPRRVTRDLGPHHERRGTAQRWRRRRRAQSPGEECTHKATEGLSPRHARQWFRPALATPRGGASSPAPDFNPRKQIGAVCRVHRVPWGRDCQWLGRGRLLSG